MQLRLRTIRHSLWAKINETVVIINALLCYLDMFWHWNKLFCFPSRPERKLETWYHSARVKPFFFYTTNLCKFNVLFLVKTDAGHAQTLPEKPSQLSGTLQQPQKELVKKIVKLRQSFSFLPLRRNRILHHGRKLRK